MVVLPQPEGPSSATNSPGAMLRSMPVSYTHLDVYKRQVIDQALRGGVSGDIRDDRGNYQKGSETVDELTDRILELVKNQNAY